MADGHKGSCFCGGVEFEVTGAPLGMGYCHCVSCRAWSGAPVSTFTLWPADAVAVTRGAELIARYSKTGFSDRQHCTRCGGAVMVGHPGLGLADIPAGLLPTLEFRPSVHVNYASTVLPMRDGLPKMRDFPAEAGGSGEALPE
jgi:hypothetical protein